jgi:hypothetical protein
MTEGFIFDPGHNALYCIDGGGLAFLTLENIDRAAPFRRDSEWAGGHQDRWVDREQARAILTARGI